MAASGSDSKAISQFYKPYLSDESESDTDSYSSKGSTASTSSSASSSPPVPPSQSRANVFSSGGATVSEVSGDFVKIPMYPMGAPQAFNQTNPAFTSTKLSSTIMLNSRDRDTNIFPQPSAFSIRLPRLYRNVAAISVSQIKMLSAFYYFTDVKNNTSIRVQELGRQKTVNGAVVDNALDVFIRNGTYDVNSLINELNNQMNKTPLYNIITKADFTSKFTTSGDFTLLFNPPGDTTYNSLTGVFESLQTTNDIVAKYFNTSGSLGVSYYSPNEILVAYYYPMLKDLTISQVSSTTPLPVNPFIPIVTKFVINNNKSYLPINYNQTDAASILLLNGSTYYDRIVYGFQGLTDPYVLSVIQNPANQAILDKYKADNTWFNYLVNKYVGSYDSNGGRLTIYSKQLNTSIVSDLNAQYQTILTQQLVKNGVSPLQVNTIQQNATNLNGASIDMYNYIQRQFMNFFGINYGSLSSSFYTKFSNKLNIFDASGRYGWDLTFQGTQTSTGIVDNYPDLSGYWPNLTLTASKKDAAGNPTTEYYCPNQLDSSQKVRYTYTKPMAADARGLLQLAGGSESCYGYQDISANITPTSYFRTSFKSRCRQTLFIAVTPPPNNNLSENYYLDKTNTPLLYNSTSDLLIDAVGSAFTFYDISQNMLDGTDYMRSVDNNKAPRFLAFMKQIKPALDTNLKTGAVSLFSYNTVLFFRLLHGGYPVPLHLSGNTTKFKSDIYIEREDGLPFGVNMAVYWYRDRAAFMADATTYIKNVNYSNPTHYFSKTIINAKDNISVITNTFISYDYSFFLIKALSPPSQMALRVFCIRHDEYGIYSIANNTTDLRRLPIDPIYLANKTDPIKSFPSDKPQLFNSTRFRNSYDLEGISNNLLDYNILNADATHFDPYNFIDNVGPLASATRYLFQYSSPALLPSSGIDTWSQYFYSNSTNSILDTSANSIIYNPTKAAAEIASGLLPYKDNNNEYVFTNWFRAGATTNLFTYYDLSGNLQKSPSTPANYPEQAIMPYGTTNIFSGFSYGQPDISGGSSPFSICFKKGTSLVTDISFNQINVSNSNQLVLNASTLTSVIGIPFMPQSGDFVIPKKVVIKFAYIQPNKNAAGFVGRTNSLKSTLGDNYTYSTYSTNTSYSGPSDISVWDDKYIANRQNVVLGVFYIRDILNKKSLLSAVDLSNNVVSYIDIEKALCTLSLKKIVQTGNYVTTSGGTSNTKTRSPDWGTYYIYEKSVVPKNSWVPIKQTVTGSGANSGINTQWAVVNQPPDISGNIYMSARSAESEASEYYSDISNNALCFVPFYPVLNSTETLVTQDTNPAVAPFSKPFKTWKPAYTTYKYSSELNPLGIMVQTATPTNNPSVGNWRVGSFTGLTYTNRPYLPFKTCAPLRINPIIYHKGTTGKIESLCIEDLGGNGLASGINSTYLGTCGSFCLGINSTNTVKIANPTIPTYFNIRVNVETRDDPFNPIKDIINNPKLSSTYANTMLFAYDISQNAVGWTVTNDIVDIQNGWGLETKKNYLAYDNNSGFNYLSYLNSFSVEAGQNYSLNLRSYLPTTALNCGIRIMGKNWCDFGYLTLGRLMKEIDAIIAGGVILNADGTLTDPFNFRILNSYTYNYTRTLLQFNQRFIGAFIYGRGFTNASYGGLSVNATGFTDFMTQFKQLSESVVTATAGITAAQSLALSSTKAYIKSNYSGILPDVVLQRNRYTDPLSFSLLFQSALISPYKDSFDQWGLGWNLGFDKIDTTFSTRCVASTFVRIVDDFIYMKLNDEFNCNGIDSSDKEDLNKNRDSTGKTRGYFGKLLLNAFGSFAQTFVQSAKPFPSTIPKVDQLRFSFVDANNNQIFNNDCEFNISLEISEVVDALDVNSALVRGMGGVAAPKPPA